MSRVEEKANVQASPALERPRLADLVTDQEVPSLTESFPPKTWIKIGVIGLLFIILNNWQFLRLYNTYLGNPNWTFGFAIPLFSMWLLYARRDELLTAERRTCWLGIPIMFFSLVGIYAGVWPIGTMWVSHISMVFLLFGLVLYLAGPRVIKVTWLPILYLALAMPIPQTIYQRIALHLQNLAAAASAGLLQVLGVRLELGNSNITLWSQSGAQHSLTVAEACSGVRSMMAFVALGVAMAWLTYRPVWQRIVLLISIVPVAIAANVLRVTITTSMFYFDKPELGQDFMHKFLGLLVLIPAAVMFWLLLKLLDAMFVEADDEEPDEDAEVSSA
ncbi:MAG: exosortase/archaeosortase family protein [Phycisphaerae bacterium]